jgi:hypothetical protein
MRKQSRALGFLTLPSMGCWQCRGKGPRLGTVGFLAYTCCVAVNAVDCPPFLLLPLLLVPSCWPCNRFFELVGPLYAMVSHGVDRVSVHVVLLFCPAGVAVGLLPHQHLQRSGSGHMGTGDCAVSPLLWSTHTLLVSPCTQCRHQ